VQFGAADIGVAGKDVLLEHGAEGLYEPVDLKIATCKLMTAGLADADSNNQNSNGRLRVATKFTNVAKRFFESRGEQVEVIKLYGSMELGPIVGLADLIVDVVDTGNTLKANGLKPIDHIADVSSRLVVNKASMKMKHQTISGIIEKIKAAVEKNA
jgi:ATP phosphoribosyltransferase